MNSTRSTARADNVLPYLSAGILAHILIGSYPVFGKRAIAEVPKFSLVFIASMAITTTAILWMRYREGVTWQRYLHVLRRERILWLFVAVVSLRAVTNIISISLTRAVWVQLINIMAPFPVAFLGAWFFAQPIPRFTLPAVLLSTTGAALMLVQDWSQLTNGFTPQDALGLGLATVSMLAFAFYYQLIRRSRLRAATSGIVLFQQGMAMTLSFLVLTLVTGEDWSAWAHMSGGGWASALIYIIFVQAGGNLSQVIAVGGVSPALITNFMALRLLSAMVLAAIILGETLVTPLQWLGAAIVIATVTAYLWFQGRSHSRHPT
ncbi:MAG: DMT family transporter [Caldilineae bacterium]|nr:MAG: DMT family transporter [Caldilineae bacterium]